MHSKNWLTSATLSLRLTLLELQFCWPSACDCSSRFSNISICSLQYAFCSLKCIFCSSRSLSLFVTQSLILAAFASTWFASEHICWHCLWIISSQLILSIQLIQKKSLIFRLPKFQPYNQVNAFIILTLPIFYSAFAFFLVGHHCDAFSCLCTLQSATVRNSLMK